MKRATIDARMCSLCEIGQEESLEHLILTCPSHEDTRIGMYNKISSTGVHNQNPELTKVILGGFAQGVSYNDMVPVWKYSGDYICKMYYKVLKSRNGI